jgi:hypothetical protein
VLSLLIAAEASTALNVSSSAGTECIILWQGRSRDCHIEPDWLRLSKIDGHDLILARTGTYADPFR